MAFFVALLIAASSGFASAATDYDETDFPQMKGNIAVRMMSNGADATRAQIGETFTLQFWIDGIDPYAMTIPVSWDPAIVEVVDSRTGTAVTSGFKREGDLNNNAGFRAGGKCYDDSYDPHTFEPLYWNGRPVFSENTGGDRAGYPYLSQTGGHYRFFYYTSAPTMPSGPQMILEITFKGKKAGEPGFKIATGKSGGNEEQFDPASPEGLEAAFQSDDSESEGNVVNYTNQIEIPTFKVVTEQEMNQRPDVIPEHSTNPDTLKNPAVSIKAEASMEPAQHLTFMPYDTVYTSAVVTTTAEGKITNDCHYVIPQSVLAQSIEEASNQGMRSITVKMPEQLIVMNGYPMEVRCNSFSDMLRNQIAMLYLESPYGYIGMNPAVVLDETGKDAVLLITAEEYGNGIKISLLVDQKEKKGFEGAAFRIILPYSNADEKAASIPFSYDVFGGVPYNRTNLPLSVNAQDGEKGAKIFLSPCTGAFTIETKNAERFNDLGQAEWSRTAVEHLSQNGIISGVGEGTFDPMSTVTRAQFAKMMVCTFGFYQTQLETGFQDIKPEDILFPYVVSAQKAGLVSGLSDSRFGAQESIKRQDIAVIAYRGIQSMGIQLPETRETVTFSDDGEISQYAKEAVYAMYRAGILDGDGTGRFDPQGNASRAASARITDGVFQLIGGVI